jgi:hypothetical protein
VDAVAFSADQPVGTAAFPAGHPAGAGALADQPAGAEAFAADQPTGAGALAVQPAGAGALADQPAGAEALADGQPAGARTGAASKDAVVPVEAKTRRAQRYSELPGLDQARR